MSRHFMRAAGVALAITLVFVGGSFSAGAASKPSKAFQIRLATRTLTPAPGADVAAIKRLWRGAATRDVHFLLQLDRLAAPRGKAALAADGVQLLNYVSGKTYIAKTTISRIGGVADRPGVRWLGTLNPNDKLSPALRAGKIGRWASAPGGRVVLTVQVHPDVGIHRALGLVRFYGGKVLSAAPFIPSVTASFRRGVAARIARADIVQFVGVVDLPLGELNDGARAAANVTPLASAPYNLNGAGVNVLVYDSGLVDPAHTDFAGRIIQTDGDTTEVVRNHSTHVAGTALGSGANSTGNDSAGNLNGGTANQWAGMAPGASLRTFGSAGSTDTLYDSAGDINADFTTAIGAAGGTDVATMSLGNNVVPNGFPCGQLGDYANTSILLDNIVTGSISGQQLIYFEAVGNERNAAGTCSATGYSMVSSPATAKDTIAVGAINSNDNTMTGFSSWGPTDDGRLKPDIVAPGCQTTGDNNITSTGFNDTDGDGNLDTGEVQNTYVRMCGTSMATPVAAGAMADLVQRWKALYGATTRPRADTAKAIDIHTATDLGNTGPDYSNGWGALNAQAAVDLVNADASADIINLDQVANGGTDYYTFNSDGSAPIRVTLVWSDPPATRLAATTLINNLDLRLIGPDGTTVQPQVLNAGSPANASAQGNDSVNPVEMVTAPAQAGSWQVSVAGTAVPQGPQAYTLITPTDAAPDNRVPVAEAGGPYGTSEGTAVTVTAAGSSDPDGDSLTYAWDLDSDGAYDDATGTTASFLPGDNGTFTVAVKATDPDGAFDTDTAAVTVLNVPPTAGAITAPSGPLSIGTLITASAPFSDPGFLDTFTAVWDWGDGTTTTIPLGAGSTSTTASHTYTSSDIYTITLTVTDDDGGSGSSAFQYVVVFDPARTLAVNAKITSPTGAYVPNPSRTGEAFSSSGARYKSGVPNGATSFQFNAGPFSFNASTYKWLVVASGGRAYLLGTGIANGLSGYSFLLSVVDGTPDRYRLRVWNTLTTAVLYDSQFSAPINAPAAAPLLAGSVVLG